MKITLRCQRIITAPLAKPMKVRGGKAGKQRTDLDVLAKGTQMYAFGKPDGIQSDVAKFGKFDKECTRSEGWQHTTTLDVVKHIDHTVSRVQIDHDIEDVQNLLKLILKFKGYQATDFLFNETNAKNLEKGKRYRTPKLHLLRQHDGYNRVKVNVVIQWEGCPEGGLLIGTIVVRKAFCRSVPIETHIERNNSTLNKRRELYMGNDGKVYDKHVEERTTSNKQERKLYRQDQYDYLIDGHCIERVKQRIADCMAELK